MFIADVAWPSYRRIDGANGQMPQVPTALAVLGRDGPVGRGQAGHDFFGERLPWDVVLMQQHLGHKGWREKSKGLLYLVLGVMGSCKS